jgi:phosphatidylethanolamine-binding protein (PEBP) family uncharacterized protein
MLFCLAEINRKGTFMSRSFWKPSCVVLLVGLLQPGCDLASLFSLSGDAGVLPDETASGSTSFSLTSDVGVDGGTLPADYTCDGSGASPALSWSNAPAGTKEFALLMTTLPGDGTTKWNRVLYGIPAPTTGLAKNSSGVGTAGVGSDGPSMAYQPPCSQGPGAKLYTFTLYALSTSPVRPSAANQATGKVLTDAVSSITLGTATLTLGYTRPAGATSNNPPPNGRGGDPNNPPPPTGGGGAAPDNTFDISDNAASFVAVIAVLTGYCVSARSADRPSSATPRDQASFPGLALIPAGAFEMGDHHGFVDPKHGGDETPVHTMRLDAFHMGIHAVTTHQYCEFLNSALAQGMIEARKGGVYLVSGKTLLCETREMSPYSRIGWDGKRFSVLDRKEDHPIVCIRWPGAAVYCNWLGEHVRPNG